MFRRKHLALLLPLLLACGTDPAPTGDDGSRQIPADLETVESAAEDAYDKALLDDAAAVAADATTMASAWDAFRQQALDDGASQEIVDAMDAAIASLSADPATSGPALAREANAVSAPMDALYALYEPVVPAAVLRLDYLGREVALDGLDGDLERATADVGRVEAVWNDLRDAVVEAGGDAEAADFDASIAAERAAIASGHGAEVTIEANVQLELVDVLEDVLAAAADGPHEEEEDDTEE